MIFFSAYRNLNNALKRYLLGVCNQKPLMINYVITLADLERCVLCYNFCLCDYLLVERNFKQHTSHLTLLECCVNIHA